MRDFHRVLHNRFRTRRGTILVVAMWAMIVLTAIVLVMARSMRVEVVSSGNRMSALQASAIVHGAEQYVLSLVENAGGDPTAVIDAPAEALPVGEGYFWLIKADSGNEQLTAFGMTDEAGKVSLNAATAVELNKLPGMTSDVVDALLDWRDSDDNVTNQGAENSYYMSLPQPYNAKNGPLETVEELRMIRGMTEEILYGYDRNHDGVLSQEERNYGGTASSFNAANGAGRGIAPFVTVYSVEANAGRALPNVNDDTSTPLRDALRKALKQSRADAILSQASRKKPFLSVFDFCAKGGMTAQEVKLIYSKVSASKARTLVGRINVNTAPRETLATLPGIEQSDVDNLLSKRAGQSTDITWLYDAVGPVKAGLLGARVTNKSYQYAADIVAITGNGRVFKRVRIVVDGRSTPAKIIYRKDLTSLGWPLEESIRQTVRTGGTLVTPYGGGGSAGSGF